MKCGETLSDFIDSIYHDVNICQADDYFSDHTILSVHNDDVDEINNLILFKFPGEQKVYLSYDKIEARKDAEDGGQLEFLPEYPTQSIFLAFLLPNFLESRMSCP